MAGPVCRLVAAVGDELPIGAVLAIVAPEEVPDAEIDAVVEEAKAAVASGTLDVPDEPQPQLVEIGGRQISYLTLAPEDPSGEPVVLVHGFGGDKNSWLFVQQPLAEERTVHALDLPGHGASGKDVGDGSLAMLTDTVVGFLDAVGVERAHLVGHSLGGAVIVAVAKAAPVDEQSDRVRRAERGVAEQRGRHQRVPLRDLFGQRANAGAENSSITAVTGSSARIRGREAFPGDGNAR